VVLVDANQRFQKGDVLAARLSIPAGHKTEIMAQPVTYYLQMLPVLKSFEHFLHQQGHKDASLKVGEDVGQIDMVACASPHWGPPWLGGTTQTVNTVIANCVHKNGWAMKQLVQTQPAVVFLVGQASWNMFRQSFGHLVRSASPLPPIPEDGPYTLLQLTAAQEHAWNLLSRREKRNTNYLRACPANSASTSNSLRDAPTASLLRKSRTAIIFSNRRQLQL
jgi:hypothetical protein